jgi:hypothetical protein
MSKSFRSSDIGYGSWPEMLDILWRTKTLVEQRRASDVRCRYCEHLGGTIWVWRAPGAYFTDSYFKCDNPRCDAVNLPPYTKG